jgi:hypothetical protein
MFQMLRYLSGVMEARKRSEYAASDSASSASSGKEAILGRDLILRNRTRS